MLIAIDIGNSRTKFGLFENHELIRRVSLATHRIRETDDLVAEAFGLLPEKAKTVVIGSVVAGMAALLGEMAKDRLGADAVVIGHDADLGLTIDYSPPADCGIDRLLAASAGASIYGSPCIVCDFGTASTIDVVTKKNEFLGGVITAGPGTIADALFRETSRLPKVPFERTGSVIGKTTESSIRSGLYFGYVEMVDGIIRRMRSEQDTGPRVIATGGFAELISKESEFVDQVDNALILKGLALACERSRG